jgi:hypothetical protein
VSRRPRREAGPFAMLPVDVLTSKAVRTLPHLAHRVLVALAAQFVGRNNGSLTLPRPTARAYGIGDSHGLAAALRELEDRGLVVRTRPGTRIPPRSAMYAVTWRGIDEPLSHDRHDAKPNPIPRHSYSAWTPSIDHPHWTAIRRAARWRVPTSPSGASPHEGLEISGASPHRGVPAPVAHLHHSHISGAGAALSRQRRRKAA